MFEDAPEDMPVVWVTGIPEEWLSSTGLVTETEKLPPKIPEKAALYMTEEEPDYSSEFAYFTDFLPKKIEAPVRSYVGPLRTKAPIAEVDKFVHPILKYMRRDYI